MRYINESDLDYTFESMSFTEDDAFTCPYCRDVSAVVADDDGGVAPGSDVICIVCGVIYTLTLTHNSSWLNPEPDRRLTMTSVDSLRVIAAAATYDEETEDPESEYVN